MPRLRSLLSWRAAVFALLIALPALASTLDSADLRQSQLRLVAAYGVLGLAQVIVSGIAGIVHFGLVASSAVGAYAYAYAGNEWELPLPLALVFAIGLAGLSGALIAVPLLRLTGYYLALATLGLWLASISLMQSWKDFTGGINGTFVPDAGLSPGSLTAVYLGALGLVVILADGAVRGRRGRELLALRDDPDALPGLGVSVDLYRVAIFGIGGAIAGLGGILYTAEAGYMNPSTFNLQLLVLIMVVAVFGGIRSVWGAVFGAFGVMTLEELVSGYPESAPLLYGMGFLLVMLVMPSGMVGFLTGIVDRLRPDKPDAGATPTTADGPAFRSPAPVGEGRT